MFNFLKRSDRQPVASVAVAPVSDEQTRYPEHSLDEPLPRIISDETYVPFTEGLTEDNIEDAMSTLMTEIGQPDYNASAAIAAIQTPQDRVDLIMAAMNYMMDGCGDGFDDEEFEDEDDLDDEEEDATYATVKAFILARKNITITPQEYLDANRFSFSV